MTNPEAQLAVLRALRDATTDPLQQAALDAALAALGAGATVRSHTQSIGDRAQVDLAVAGDVHGNVYLDGRRADAAARLLADYLTRLRGRCGAIPLEGMRQQQQVGDVLPIRLDQVYTQLTVTGNVRRELFTGAALRALDLDRYLEEHTGEHLLPWQRRISLERSLTPDERREQQQDIKRMARPDAPFISTDALLSDTIGRLVEGLDRDALGKILSEIDQLAFFGPRLVTDAIVDSRKLVLLGEPGSGKSTALRYLALTLAEAGLVPALDLSARLAGWERFGEQGRLLPIFLPLLPFARWLIEDPARAGGADDLWEYIADQLEPGKVRTGLAEAVHAELAAGCALLLLDGLDEVAGAESRRKVVRAVRLFAEEYAQCRMVVTCRVRAYEGMHNRAWQLPNWPTTVLAEWDVAQQQHFIAAWYTAAVEAGGLPELQRSDRVTALQRAIAASRDLQRLATRPLLLTIMALVHLNDGRLPEDRVTLYSRCIDILLGQWELRGKEQTVYGSLMSYIGLFTTVQKI